MVSTASSCYAASLIYCIIVNRFAGMRLEDLQGEIPSLCKDQHGCRYLQKKLEEAVPEHRDMIFRETFGHFAELMTGKAVSPKPLSLMLMRVQIPLGTTCARSCWSTVPMSSAI